MHVSLKGKALFTLCWWVQWESLHMLKMQTCITCMAIQMVMAEHHAQFSDWRMPDHRIFQWLHYQLSETGSFYLTRHEASEQRTVHSPSLEESILNTVANRPKFSARAVVHQVSVSHQTICRVINENPLHSLHFQPVQALVNYPLHLNFCQLVMQ